MGYGHLLRLTHADANEHQREWQHENATDENDELLHSILLTVV
jgi:hypothetical protein